MSDKILKILKLALCLIFMLASIYLIYNYYDGKKVESAPKNTPVKENKNRKLIDNLKEEYNNDEIVMLLEIPNVLKTPIVQTDDNKYYYTHDLYRDNKKAGVPFLDYRNKSLNDKKLIIYDLKSEEDDAFTNLENYQREDYFHNNSIINVYTEKDTKEYKIFSCYIETSDFDYTNLNSYDGLTYLEHINKLKTKSLYDTDVVLENSSKIIILDLTLDQSQKKDMLVIGVEVPKEEIFSQ